MANILSFVKGVAKIRSTRAIREGLKKGESSIFSSPGLEEVRDLVRSTVPTMHGRNAEGPLIKVGQYMSEAGVPLKEQERILRSVATDLGGENNVTMRPYEDIDAMLKYYEDSPLSGARPGLRIVRQRLRQEKLVRRGQGAEHPELYGPAGDPFRFNPKKELDFLNMYLDGRIKHSATAEELQNVRRQIEQIKLLLGGKGAK